MRQEPDPHLPMSRAMLPEGCSDLVEAYQIREANKKARSLFLLRIAALLHDDLIRQLDPAILATKNPDDVLHAISDFLHPILLANPNLERAIQPSSEFVEIVYQVVMANQDDA